MRAVAKQCRHYVEVCRLDYEAKGALDAALTETAKDEAVDLIEGAMSALGPADVRALDPTVNKLLDPKLPSDQVDAAYGRLVAEICKRERIGGLLLQREDGAPQTAAEPCAEPRASSLDEAESSTLARQVLGLERGAVVVVPWNGGDSKEDEAERAAARLGARRSGGGNENKKAEVVSRRRVRVDGDTQAQLGEVARVSVEALGAISKLADQRRIRDRASTMPAFAQRDVVARSQKASDGARLERDACLDELCALLDANGVHPTAVDEASPDTDVLQSCAAAADALQAHSMNDDDDTLAAALSDLAQVAQTHLRRLRGSNVRTRQSTISAPITPDRLPQARARESAKPKAAAPARIKPKAPRSNFTSRHLDFEPELQGLSLAGASPAFAKNGTEARRPLH